MNSLVHSKSKCIALGTLFAKLKDKGEQKCGKKGGRKKAKKNVDA